MDIKTIKKKIVPILKKEGATKAAIFGSVAKGEANKKSDVDILVELPKSKSLLDLIHLELKLEKKIKKKIDLLEFKAIKPNLKKIILAEQKIIYEKKKRS